MGILLQHKMTAFYIAKKDGLLRRLCAAHCGNVEVDAQLIDPKVTRRGICAMICFRANGTPTIAVQ